jgi:hypothetical protein
MVNQDSVVTVNNHLLVAFNKDPADSVSSRTVFSANQDSVHLGLQLMVNQDSGVTVNNPLLVVCNKDPADSVSSRMVVSANQDLVNQDSVHLDLQLMVNQDSVVTVSNPSLDSINQDSVHFLKFSNNPVASIHSNHHATSFRNSYSIIIQERI